jgi:ADP-heptose:LPS heptosyltransferase
MNSIACRYCGAATRRIFTARVLKRYDVAYYQCPSCRLVQTEEPYWLEEAYKNPIGELDTWQLERSLYASVAVQSLLPQLGIEHPRVLDYGAGYGMLVRLLRNAGIEAYWSDRYAPNLFAQGCQWDGTPVDLVTCFEVAEHFVEPAIEFDELLSRGRTVLLSTVLLPDPPPPPDAWEYYALDGGQHVALYTLDTLRAIARRFGVQLWSNGHNLHVLSDRAFALENLTTHQGWNRTIGRIEGTFSPTTMHPRLQPVPLHTQPQPQIGIAIFHGLGDVLNATIIARQIRADRPNAHIVWYTAAQYAFVLEGNPDVDEIVPLDGDPKALDSCIEKLRSERSWDAFYVPAPYLAYEKLPGGDLTELMLATYDRPLTVPLRPVMVLSEQEVERARQWWAQLPSDRPRILVETEFFSQQSPWDFSYAVALIEALTQHRPVFVFTAKNCPPYWDELRTVYPDCVWCDLPFRLNAELYNLCDAFVGVSSAISCLSNSTWCRHDVPHIEVVSGPHWSTWHFQHHTQRWICFDRDAFDQATKQLSALLGGKHVQTPPQQTLAQLYLRRIEGKYHWLSPALLPTSQTKISHTDAARAIVRTLESLEPFYLCYGGIGDFLLALSTPLEHDEPITVVAAPNSTAAARAFFDCFPEIERVYFIERPDDPSDRYLSGLFLRAATARCKNCRGRGVTPPGREDDFWKPGLDIVCTCGITLHPAWVQRYRVEQIEQPQVVLAPMGSLSGMFRSKRNAIPPQYWDRFLALLRANGIRPLIVGTPDEAVAYPADGWAHDKRSYSFEEQFRLLASADLVIAADSWHKTFAAMAGVATIVFAPMTNHDLDFWQDSSRVVFCDPWPNITYARSWDEAFAAAREHLAARAGITLEHLAVQPPRERPRRTNPRQPLTSFHPVFWEREYQNARTAHVRLSDALGDALMATAVIEALKVAHPHLSITVAAHPHAAEIFRGNPSIERCVSVNTSDDLRCEAVADVVVDYRYVLDQLPEYYGVLPMMDILANIAGIRLPSKQLSYFPTGEERTRAAELLATRRGVAVHLESRKDPLRSYPHAAELLRAMTASAPEHTVIWLGSSPSPLTSPSIIDASMLPLREQIALVERCMAAVVIDSVFFHVAHNLHRKPTLLIAGPTSEYLIGDYTAAPLVTLRAVGCTPCYWNVKRCRGVCTTSLAPSDVAAATATFLDRAEHGMLRITSPEPAILRCTWDSQQHNLFAQCMHHRAVGSTPVRLHIVEATEPLPDYAELWNGVELIRNATPKMSHFQQVFHQ